MFLSIITPTYNRGEFLVDIYQNLLTNDRNDFEWIIVDDGSTDDTQKIVSQWLLQNQMNIKYIKQLNQGKTAALITAFESIIKGGRFSLVLDSDDYLVQGIISELKQASKSLLNNQIGMVGLKSTRNAELIGTEFTAKSSTYVNLYFGKNKVYGDKLFIIRTELYSASFISSFSNEKFIPDSVPYLKLNDFGEYKCINRVVYSGDYLEDGMTNNVLKLAANNINGFIYEKQLLQKQKLHLVEKLKNEVKYISYSFAGSKNICEIIRNSNHKILTLFLLFPVYIVTFVRIFKIINYRQKNRL